MTILADPKPPRPHAECRPYFLQGTSADDAAVIERAHALWQTVPEMQVASRGEWPTDWRALSAEWINGKLPTHWGWIDIWRGETIDIEICDNSVSGEQTTWPLL